MRAITAIRSFVPTLAPEMEFKNDGARSAIDEYFEKFRAAGLKVGVCIRPQQIKMVDRNPMRQAAEDEHAARFFGKGSPTRNSDGVAHFSMWIQPRLHMA